MAHGLQILANTCIRMFRDKMNKHELSTREGRTNDAFFTVPNRKKNVGQHCLLLRLKSSCRDELQDCVSSRRDI
jgi:hypothetical protein